MLTLTCLNVLPDNQFFLNIWQYDVFSSSEPQDFCCLKLQIECIDTNYKKEKPTIKVFPISRANPDIRNAKQFSPRTTDHGLALPIHWHFCPTLTWAHSKPPTIFTQFNFAQFFCGSFSYHIILCDPYIIAFWICIDIKITWLDAHIYLMHATMIFEHTNDIWRSKQSDLV